MTHEVKNLQYKDITIEHNGFKFWIRLVIDDNGHASNIDESLFIYSGLGSRYATFNLENNDSHFFLEFIEEILDTIKKELK